MSKIEELQKRIEHLETEVELLKEIIKLLKKYFAPELSKHIEDVVNYYLSDKYIGDKEVQ